MTYFQPVMYRDFCSHVIQWVYNIANRAGKIKPFNGFLLNMWGFMVGSLLFHWNLWELKKPSNTHKDNKWISCIFQNNPTLAVLNVGQNTVLIIDGKELLVVCVHLLRTYMFSLVFLTFFFLSHGSVGVALLATLQLSSLCTVKLHYVQWCNNAFHSVGVKNEGHNVRWSFEPHNAVTFTFDD